ncbi:hypothetical protein DWB61_17375 [Ancylomarina euxinus]|uniref:Uncharacterized protein n=1 Tax=Ancylomarina euxinus TaxID=2283627 RepID=A0A425XWG5_9BACT|nr:hypothetical protein [Ancylomarina euxinus]MCZ4696420.1 hypothetical protein [Ancylomarina euxinus]MUP15642.1 hypothetical protein [Ancylomarina euxinus]RRG18988.1 hypothetical protein DWB61_17375 [Ancylomarina euxinus]
MISFRNIKSDELEQLISKLDENIAFVNSEFGIELKSYGTILRIAINAIQQETIENLTERLSINKELENGLEDAGGYTTDYLDENNPKAELLKILKYLQDDLPKRNVLVNYLNKVTKKTIAVFDTNDLDFISRQIRNRKVEIVPFSSLKKLEIKDKVLVVHSFNGQKDFDYLYNLVNEVVLVVYKQEKNLYYKCLNQRKKLIESEIKSKDRFSICGIEYKEVRDNITDISTTINGIVSRLDEMNGRAYDGFKNECDLLLNEIDEKLIYKIVSDVETVFLESNDTVFTETGELIKAYKIKKGNRVRIYPKEQLAENLYQVAVETEPDVFGTVEEHSAYWKQLINELRANLGDELLYKKLKEKGLKVLPTTLVTYGKGFRKFPMYKNDLRAIFKLYYLDKSDNEIDVILKPILKSKTTYSSTMIVLGRGLKQELRLFLKKRRIGEILAKKNFKENTLQAFINDFMPLHTVIDKEAFSDDIEFLEETTLEQIEL